MEIPHEFFLNTPENSTSFLIDPWNFRMLCLEYPWKFRLLSSCPQPSIPCLDFSGIAHWQSLKFQVLVMVMETVELKLI